MPKAITIHQILTWLAGVMSTVTATAVWSISGAFLDMHNRLIRMEPLPATVQSHETRLDEHAFKLYKLETTQTKNDTK